MSAQIDDIIRRALAEDAPWGDVTSEAFLPAGATASAALVAREPGVFSGAEVFARVFELVDADTTTELGLDDGEPFAPGAVLARVDGTAARIVDTRKTTPGLRILERQAVRDGGGRNHRFSLSDAVMAKDNHLAVLAASGVPVGEAIRRARARLGHTVHLEVEVDRIEQIEEVVAAGVDTIMLDNFTPGQLRDGLAIVAGRAIVEASGGVNLDTVRAIAETGVDVISVGALTHSVRSLDLGLDVAIAG